MSIRVLVLALLAALSTGCSRLQSGYSITIGHNNLSDSFIHPYRLSVNEKGGFPGGGLKRCSNNTGINSLAQVSLSQAPQFVFVQWQHILSGNYYRAKILLDKRIGQWLHTSPFGGDNHAANAMIVQWRGEKEVAVMLVADFTDFSHGSIELGKAVGEAMPAPELRPNYEVTYNEVGTKPGGRFLPGNIVNYDRSLDDVLSREQRFGCPRKQNGDIDDTRLPPEKLPFFYGENGEHIPCRMYFCAENEALRARLRELGWRNYPADIAPPPYRFPDSQDPRPAR